MKTKRQIIEEYAQKVAPMLNAFYSIEPLRKTLRHWRESKVEYADNSRLCLPPAYQIIHAECAMCEAYLFCKGCPLAVRQNMKCAETMNALIGRGLRIHIFKSSVVLPRCSRSTVYRFRKNVIRTLERIIELYEKEVPE